jgi:N-acetylmuramoyl-L-alanine amidase
MDEPEKPGRGRASRRSLLALGGAAAGLAAAPWIAGAAVAAVPKIYIDPGHGGSDSGAVGNGLVEKHLTLDLALRLNHILKVVYGYQTRLSRTTDIDRSLSYRSTDANNWGANLFISIHINSATGTAGTGFESYRYTGAGATTVARHRLLHPEIVRSIRTVAAVADRGMKTAGYHVLRYTTMSAILTENLFINNPADAALLRRDDFRHALAAGHAQGIRRMFG